MQTTNINQKQSNLQKQIMKRKNLDNSSGLGGSYVNTDDHSVMETQN